MASAVFDSICLCLARRNPPNTLIMISQENKNNLNLEICSQQKQDYEKGFMLYEVLDILKLIQKADTSRGEIFRIRNMGLFGIMEMLIKTSKLLHN